MRRLVPVVLRPSLLPFIVLGLVGPSIAAFATAGPQLGLAVGALTAAVVVVAAARARYDEPIEVAAAPDARYRLLVLTSRPLEEPGQAAAVAAIAGDGQAATRADPAAEPALRVVVPALESRLARWTSDPERARAEATATLATTLGSLTAAGLDAGGTVGDPSAVQAIEDELRSFAAAEVVALRGPGIGEPELEEVRRRLDRPVRELGELP